MTNEEKIDEYEMKINLLKAEISVLKMRLNNQESQQNNSEMLDLLNRVIANRSGRKVEVV